MKVKRLSKKNRKAWWRSLTAEQQTEYRCRKMEEEGKRFNYDEVYSQILKENNYMR